MAVDWSVEVTRADALRFRPQDIKLKPELNGRAELPDIEALIADIVANGQLVPCLVRNDGGVPVMLDGHSRLRAIIEINKRKLTPVPMKVSCILFKGAERDGFLKGISCNKARNSTTPLDDGHNIARLERYNMSVAEIAAFYQEDEGWVRRRLAFVRLSEPARKAVKNGAVLPNAVTALAKLSEEQQALAVEGATHANPVSKGNLKPESVQRPSLRATVNAIAAGGAPPFPVLPDDSAKEFCERLKLYCFGEGK